MTEQHQSGVPERSQAIGPEENLVPLVPEKIATPAAQVPLDMKEKFPCIVCNINFDSTTMRNYHEKVAHNGIGQILFTASKNFRLKYRFDCNLISDKFLVY